MKTDMTTLDDLANMLSLSLMFTADGVKVQLERASFSLQNLEDLFMFYQGRLFAHCCFSGTTGTAHQHSSSWSKSVTLDVIASWLM